MQDENFLLKNKLLECEAHCENLKKLNAQKKPVREIYIADPIKANIELMNEVKASRELVQNVSKKYNQLLIEKEQLFKQKDVTPFFYILFTLFIFIFNQFKILEIRI